MEEVEAVIAQQRKKKLPPWWRETLTERPVKVGGGVRVFCPGQRGYRVVRKKPGR